MTVVIGWYLAAWRRSSMATRLVGAAVLAAFAGALLSLGSLESVLIGSAVQLLFIAPGVLIVARTLPKNAGWLPSVAFGPIIGLGLSSLALLGLWAAGARVAGKAPALVRRPGRAAAAAGFRSAADAGLTGLRGARCRIGYRARFK